MKKLLYTILAAGLLSPVASFCIGGYKWDVRNDSDEKIYVKLRGHNAGDATKTINPKQTSTFKTGNCLHNPDKYREGQNIGHLIYVRAADKKSSTMETSVDGSIDKKRCGSGKRSVSNLIIVDKKRREGSLYPEFFITHNLGPEQDA